jgi:hypothetical protein
MAALARGIDVRGLWHWTAVDNYEWLHGYDLPFGIIDRQRHVRPSAEVLKEAALAETGRQQSSTRAHRQDGTPSRSHRLPATSRNTATRP